MGSSHKDFAHVSRFSALSPCGWETPNGSNEILFICWDSGVISIFTQLMTVVVLLVMLDNSFLKMMIYDVLTAKIFLGYFIVLNRDSCFTAGNTLNCKHPVVMELIIDSLRHWYLYMYIYFNYFE